MTLLMDLSKRGRSEDYTSGKERFEAGSSLEEHTCSWKEKILKGKEIATPSTMNAEL